MSEIVIFRNDDKKLFWQKAENFIIEMDVSYRYSKIFYRQNYLISKNKLLFRKDKSFIYIVNNKVRALVFLPIERKNSFNAVCFNNGYVVAPLVEDEKIEKKIFNMIDEIAKKEKVGRIMFAIDPFENKVKYNFLQKYNYLDTSILQYVIDIKKEDDLLHACRRGHRCDIKKILNNKDFEVFYVDKDNSSYKIHEEYRELHHKCAGRKTRPKKTFDLQFEELKQGGAVLFGLKYKGENIAYSYFSCYGQQVVYGSGADNPDYDNLPLYHILIYSAMVYFQKKGIKYFDPEQPVSPSTQLDYYPDKKQLNISLFKRGFGGYYVNHFRGVKFFNKDIFSEYMDKFISKYSLSIK